MISEFENIKPEILKILEKYGEPRFYLGRLISGSKSTYRKNNPDNIVLFNANIITINLDKIWYGDVDITLDADALIEIAKELNEPLFILQELAGRFGEEKTKLKELIKRAYCIIKPSGEVEITGNSFCGYVMKNGKRTLINSKDLKL